MSEKCSSNCTTCGESCDQRQAPQNFLESPHHLSKIKKVFGIVSGKGGVGKSLVTAMMAVSMQRLGYQVAILDADITGPSIPKVFGLKEKAVGNDFGLLPVKTKSGIDVMSINLLLDEETKPLVWRGPIISGTVKQFWRDVIWEDIDFMFIDMPPGTGDVSLTVFQSIKVDGIIIVTSPQELVSMIVSKAVNMAQMMHIPIVGIIENMSYFKCTTCDEEHRIFGGEGVESIALHYNLPLLAKVPIEKGLATLCDQGMIELFKGEWFSDATIKMEGFIE